jgi:hypothetical protein
MVAILFITANVRPVRYGDLGAPPDRGNPAVAQGHDRIADGFPSRAIDKASVDQVNTPTVLGAPHRSRLQRNRFAHPGQSPRAGTRGLDCDLEALKGSVACTDLNVPFASLATPIPEPATAERRR